MSDALVEVTRGEIVESVHHGAIAVVDVAGSPIASYGDYEETFYFRSSAKPFQAIPVVESGAADRFEFTSAELALCCSSHDAAPWQQAAVEAMLAKIGLDASALRCGIAPPYDKVEAARTVLGLVPPSPLQCDCSGKHTGMLAACLQLGFPIDSYLERDHPLQTLIRAIMAETLRMPEHAVILAPDGCCVPTFGAPLRAFAVAYATFSNPEQAPAQGGRRHAPALNRLRAAMIAHPLHIAGPGEIDTDLIDVTHGRVVAKLGAEGLLCLAVPERGLGIAIRISDGSERARAVVAYSALQQLGLLNQTEREELGHRQPFTVSNFNGWTVGEMRPVFHLN